MQLEALLRRELCLLKEERDGTVFRDLGDKRFRVFLEKPCDSRKRHDEDLRHFLALQIARCQDKRCYARPHERQPLDVPIPDSMVFGKHNPATLPGFGEPVLVLGIRGKVVVVDVQCGSGLTERVRDTLFPQRTIEEEDGRVRPLRWRART